MKARQASNMAESTTHYGPGVARPESARGDCVTRRYSIPRVALLIAVICCATLLSLGRAYAATVATVPITAELGTSIASDLFPVTIKLSQGNVFLTEPLLLFLEQGRVGMQVRFQAYDHRPQQGVAISEMGRAQLSGTLGYDPVTRQVLLHDPKIDKLQFDDSNTATQRFTSEMQAAWSAQVTDPIRSALPPHPYLVPFRNNIQNLTYDGKSITLTLSYE